MSPKSKKPPQPSAREQKIVANWTAKNGKQFNGQWVALLLPKCQVVTCAPYLAMLHNNLDHIPLGKKKVVIVEVKI